jgi:hypothetical protein
MCYVDGNRIFLCTPVKLGRASTPPALPNLSLHAGQIRKGINAAGPALKSAALKSGPIAVAGLRRNP